jgi:Fuc2NAc and GlcNAc transferase
MSLLLPAIAALLVSCLLTCGLRRYALRKNLLAIPNERSYHTVPTPTGGGLSIVIVFLFVLILSGITGFLPVSLAAALAGAGIMVALAGWLDDHNHLPARWRLGVHILAAGWGLYWLGGAPVIEIFGYALRQHWLISILLMFYLVWLLNLYNFMDGIDGIAGIQAVTLAIGGLVLLSVAGMADADLLLMSILGGSAAGFLIWNYPPARIFMGDVGSGFLGVTFGLLTIHHASANGDLFWAWLVLLGAFIVDATLTLIRRICHGERFYQAHRSHAYQHASRKFQSHARVSVAFGVINLLWLLPIALLVATGRWEGIAGVAVAYLPLVILAWVFKAGDRRKHG